MNKIVLLIIFIALLLIGASLMSTTEPFTSSLRSYKNRQKRRIRHIAKDGFTQMKSLFT
jgi:hypothetical protein